ncbi:MAG: hypothetical protein ACE5KT_08565 [Methanosarcinales archaeon]
MFYEFKKEIVAISNTGPIISVFQCGRVDLLQRYFKEIHIPKSEIEEFDRHNIADFAEDLIDLGLFQVHNLTDFEQEKAKKIKDKRSSTPFSRI